MGIWCAGLQTGCVDNILNEFFLVLKCESSWCCPHGAWFSATSSRYYQINQRHPRSGSFSTKLIFIFQLMFVSIIFQKTDKSQLPSPRRGKTAEKTTKESSVVRRFLIQFFAKLWRTELSWDCCDKVPSQLLGDGREYSNFEFVKNISDRRVKR